jgi:hypothetical protein
MADGYRGLFGAFPFAFRRSRSRLFRGYVVVSALAAATVSLLVALGLVVLFGETAGAAGGSLTLSRSFYVVVGLLVVAPVVAPTLLVARRHRRRESTGPEYDRLLAAAGFLFLASVYLGLVVAMPDCYVLDGSRVCPEPPAGFLSILYTAPEAAAVAPPLLAVGLMVALHRYAR